MRRFLFNICLSGSLLLLPLLSGQAHAQEFTSQAERALTFIQHLDRQDFDSAWMLTSPLFQALNNQPDWIGKQLVVRQAYGPSTERSFRRSDSRTTYTLSPDGAYVIIQFSTRFAHKEQSTETVVLSEQPSGDWLVREYVIR